MCASRRASPRWAGGRSCSPPRNSVSSGCAIPTSGRRWGSWPPRSGSDRGRSPSNQALVDGSAIRGRNVPNALGVRRDIFTRVRQKRALGRRRPLRDAKPGPPFGRGADWPGHEASAAVRTELKSTLSTQSAQNVHSYEQMRAVVDAGGRSLSQHSQFGRSSSAIAPTFRRGYDEAVAPRICRKPRIPPNAGSSLDRRLLRECRSGLRILTLSLRLDLVEFGQRPFEFVIEEPHRIENFAEGRRCFRPVGPSEGEDAIVAQKSHDRRVGNSIVGEVARFESGPGRAGNDLDELEKLHLIDRIRQRFHDRGYLREQLCVRVHEAVSHGGPVIESTI